MFFSNNEDNIEIDLIEKPCAKSEQVARIQALPRKRKATDQVRSSERVKKAYSKNDKQMNREPEDSKYWIH